ncbi:MAG: 23S rRNA pseudouridine(955/2504/2580) synthase RluC [Gammaproteobacteria bacterium]|nr:23S rRNA pseudouridine(955/2504/2580) synthase RluC [Gammaproteobacteria bacterium]
MTDIKDPDTPSIRIVEVDADRAGQRIDNFLMTCLKGVPKSLVYRILRTGEVRVNKGRIKPSYRLEAGDQIRIPPVRTSDTPEAVVPTRRAQEQLEGTILYEDNGLLAINKPSGMAVHGGSGLSFGVIEALRILRPEKDHLELVHRLDRETSGCLLIAKRRSALRQLHELMRDGQMEKQYLALCMGRWKGGRVDVPLRKNVQRSGERMVTVSADGKASESRFTPLQRFADATLMEVDIYTGRTHQIRVHAAHSGHPLAADEKYGDKTFNKQMREFGLKRLFLHAQVLRFPWGDDGKMLEIRAPLDEDLSAVLKRLPK